MANRSSQNADVSLEEVPRSRFDFYNWMVNKLEEVLKNGRDVLSVLLKERTIANTDFHILKLGCRMTEGPDIYQ